MKRLQLFLLLLAFAGQTGCRMNSRHADAAPIRIHRFDRDLYRLMQSGDSGLPEEFVREYAPLLPLIGRSIFHTADTQTPEFVDRMFNYYGEPTLNGLYRDALKRFEQVETVERELADGFRFLRECFPDMQTPAVYMHVSGLQENIIVADSLLSFSADKYLGAACPLYQDYFTGRQLRRMEPACVASDCLTAWLLSEYPFRGDDRVLLERMIYEGKIRYILHRACPQLTPDVWMGYTREEYRWCRQNEKMLWHFIIERRHLFTPDAITAARYFSDAPSTFVSDDAPGSLGVWIGWRIVEKYMDKTHVSPESLMSSNDSGDILRKSKYKP
jgi:hypothetical protein